MPTNYPTTLDDFANPAGGSTLANPPHHTQHGDLNDAVESIEAELGLTPSGASATVRARAEAIEAAVFGRGATFPAQPAYGNDRPFYRTDLAMMFKYDGTRWLSTTLFEYLIDCSAVAAMAATTSPFKLNIPLPRPGANLIYVVSCQALFAVAGGGSALDGSHRWAVQLNYTPADAAMGIINVNSGASAATTRLLEDTSIQLAVPTGSVYAYLSATKVGSPGNLTVFGFLFSYRIVAT